MVKMTIAVEYIADAQSENLSVSRVCSGLGNKISQRRLLRQNAQSFREQEPLRDWQGRGSDMAMRTGGFCHTHEHLRMLLQSTYALK